MNAYPVKINVPKIDELEMLSGEKNRELIATFISCWQEIGDNFWFKRTSIIGTSSDQEFVDKILVEATVNLFDQASTVRAEDFKIYWNYYDKSNIDRQLHFMCDQPKSNSDEDIADVLITAYRRISNTSVKTLAEVVQTALASGPQ